MSALPKGCTLNLMSRHLLIAIAIEGIIRGDHTLLQSCRNRKDFGRRARLKGITDIIIPPFLVPGYLKAKETDLVC